MRTFCGIDDVHLRKYMFVAFYQGNASSCMKYYWVTYFILRKYCQLLVSQPVHTNLGGEKKRDSFNSYLKIKINNEYQENDQFPSLKVGNVQPQVCWLSLKCTFGKRISELFNRNLTFQVQLFILRANTLTAAKFGTRTLLSQIQTRWAFCQPQDCSEHKIIMLFTGTSFQSSCGACTGVVWSRSRFNFCRCLHFLLSSFLELFFVLVRIEGQHCRQELNGFNRYTVSQFLLDLDGSQNCLQRSVVIT